MRVRHAQCLVQLAPPPVRSSGLIEAPSFAKLPVVGKVVEAGPECHDVGVGDFVMIDPASGEDMGELFATPHLMVQESQLLAVLEKHA